MFVTSCEPSQHRRSNPEEISLPFAFNSWILRSKTCQAESPAALAPAAAPAALLAPTMIAAAPPLIAAVPVRPVRIPQPLVLLPSGSDQQAGGSPWAGFVLRRRGLAPGPQQGTLRSFFGPRKGMGRSWVMSFSK